MIKKAKIGNIEIFAFFTRQQFLDYIKNKDTILIAINAEKILKDEQRLQNIINNNIGYSDGFGAVMALKAKGLKAIKIPGAEFWLDIVHAFHKEKSIYLIGSSSEVITKTAKQLKNDFSDINIVGYRNGYLDKEGIEETKRILRDKKPDIIFVAQGSPKQEYLMDELINIHPALYMGLGGSFDVYCGLKQRAPKIFLTLNLEWLYRLLKEPTRFKRQFALIKFIILLKMGKL